MPGTIMQTTPPTSPSGAQRPKSVMVRPTRSNSRMSIVSNKLGNGSKASDEDTKTAVKVGKS